MKIEKKEIAEKLKNLCKALDSKLGANEGVLVRGNTLFAGGRSMGIRTNLNVPASDETFVIPKSAVGFIDSLPSGVIEITGNDKSILIKCDKKIKNKVQTFDKNYIAEPKAEDAEGAIEKLTIGGEQLTYALRSVIYAASDNAAREILNGVLLEASGGTLNIVGCDGFRIAWNTLDYGDEFKTVIPKPVAAQIVAIGFKGAVTVSLNQSLICFKDEEYEFFSHTISGEYIKYGDMFKKLTNHAVINRKSLLDCTKRALLCSADTTNNALKLKFNDNSLTVSLIKGKSEFEEIIELEESVTSPLEIGFNGKYIVEAIKDMDDDKIAVEMGNSRQPLIIHGGGLRTLVLPVSLGK